MTLDGVGDGRSVSPYPLSGSVVCCVVSLFVRTEPPEIKTDATHCSDITNDQLGISGETGHSGANLCVY